MSGCGRQIDRTPSACRDYARVLHARRVPGILRADNGDFLATRAGVGALREEAAQRAARIGVRYGGG
jgi:hypothetical protein